MQQTAVACDFDGTIINTDTGTLVLEKFAIGDWQRYEKMYETLEMPVEQVLDRQFAMVRATRKAMTSAVGDSIRFRDGFEEFLATCNERRIPFRVVSYGLDFFIRRFVARAEFGRWAEVRAPRARVTPRGISFQFPKRLVEGSTDLKVDVVRNDHLLGRRVVYVGDGASDFAAAKEADVRFAIKGSRLAQLCRQNGVVHAEITSFRPVASAVTG